MSKLPPGWASVELGNVISGFETGRNLKAASSPAQAGEYGVLKISAVTWGRFQPGENKALLHGDAPISHELVRAGDLLMSRANTTELVGAPVLVARDFPQLMLPDKILRLLYDERVIERRFLLHALRTVTARAYIEKNATGTSDSMRNLSQPKLRGIPLALAPLPEQRRIADKLDALLARVDACREHLGRVPGILKRFRQSVLAAATCGELTREWREERGLDRGAWRRTTFDRICSDITVGFVGKMSDQYRPDGVPFLRSQNVRPFRFDPRELRYISPEFHRSIAKSTLRPGDVVIVRTGAPGQCCVVPPELTEANCSDLVIARPSAELDSRFAVVFINSETSQSFVKSEQVGVAQAHFNVGSMKRAPIELPPVPEQREIARRIGELFAMVARIEERLTTARRVATRLTASVLAKAFRGELVPQDADDEPASALLARIGSRSGAPGVASKTKNERQVQDKSLNAAVGAKRRAAKGFAID